jgi:hypothetical protein
MQPRISLKDYVPIQILVSSLVPNVIGWISLDKESKPQLSTVFNTDDSFRERARLRLLGFCFAKIGQRTRIKGRATIFMIFLVQAGERAVGYS